MGPDVVVVAERPLQSSVHFAGGPPVDEPELGAQGAVAALDAAVTVGAAGREGMERDAGVAAGGLEFLHELGAAIDLHRAHGQALQGLVEEVSGGGGAGADLDVDAPGSGSWRGIA